MLLQWLGFGLAFAIALTGVATFFVRLVRELEKRQDQIEHTLYDRMGMNGLVRKVKGIEEQLDDLDLRFEMAEKNARHDAGEQIRKVIETLERIYERKRL